MITLINVCSVFLIYNLLPPANEVCEGYVFTRVCMSTGGWYPSMPCRWYPSMPCRSPGGSPGPHPGGKLRGLARGVSRPTPGGVSRPTLEGSPSSHGGCVSQHALRQAPQTATAEGGTHPTGMHSSYDHLIVGLDQHKSNECCYIIKHTILLLNPNDRMSFDIFCKT